jgi:hypothetical protein
MKALVGITRNGGELYCISISDSNIVEKDFLITCKGKIEKWQSADMGFLILDQLAAVAAVPVHRERK